MLQRPTSRIDAMHKGMRHAKHAKLVLGEFIAVCRTVYVESMASQRFLSDS
jgi:hypothetical protein